MKKNIFLFSFLLSVTLFSQVTFTKFPLNRQLIGRDLTTNLGQVLIEGTVDNTSANYAKIKVEIFRNTIYLGKEEISLNFINNTAAFNFSIYINAELANYSFDIYSEKSDLSSTLEKKIEKIVAGDAYIIQGQSNAVAGRIDFNDPSTNANIFQNDFIRVYAGGYNDPNVLINKDEWNIANGNAYMNAGANTGQWGIKLAHTIITKKNIPVAIFNGAHPAQEISFFLAPNDYKTSLNSNYGRLYYRLSRTNLKDKIRGVFWSQGEANANPEANTLKYKDDFNQLKASWLSDYPNIEHIYIFQTKNGCGKFTDNLMKIKEAQRQIAAESANISIISTDGVSHFSDLCHFPLINGYEIFADRLAPLVLRDLYGVATSNDIDVPMISDAYLKDETTIILETDSNSDLLIDNTAEYFELTSENQATITNISVNENKIIITTSKDVRNSNPTISYLGQPSGIPTSENFITNSNDLEIISFSKFLVNTSSLSLETNFAHDKIRVFPNPSNNAIEILGLKTSEPYEIYNVMCSEVKKGIVSLEGKIDIENLKKGIYLLKLTQSNQIIKFIKAK